MAPRSVQRLITVSEEIVATEPTIEQVKESIEKCTLTLRFLPNDPQLILKRAALYIKCEQFQAANADYAKAIDLVPSVESIALWETARLKYDEIVNNRCEEANAAILEGRYDDARAIYSSALQLDPTNTIKNGELHCALANLAQMMGNIEESIDQYSKALLMNNQSVNAYINRGQAHMDLGNFDSAAKDFKEALRLTPNLEHECLFDQANRLASARTEEKIGKRCMDAEMYMEAYKSYCEAINLLKADNQLEKKVLVDLHIKKAIAAYKLQMHIVVIGACTKALYLDPTQLMALRCRANNYLAMSRRHPADSSKRNYLIEKAAKDIEAIVKLEPTEENKVRLAFIRTKLERTETLLCKLGFDAFHEEKYQEAYTLFCKALKKCDENQSPTRKCDIREQILYYKGESAAKLNSS